MQSRLHDQRLGTDLTAASTSPVLLESMMSNKVSDWSKGTPMRWRARLEHGYINWIKICQWKGMFVQLNFPNISPWPRYQEHLTLSVLQISQNSPLSMVPLPRFFGFDHRVPFTQLSSQNWSLESLPFWSPDGRQVTVYISLLEDCSEKLQLLSKQKQQNHRITSIRAAQPIWRNCSYSKVQQNSLNSWRSARFVCKSIFCFATLNLGWNMSPWPQQLPHKHGRLILLFVAWHSNGFSKQEWITVPLFARHVIVKVGRSNVFSTTTPTMIFLHKQQAKQAQNDRLVQSLGEEGLRARQ